MKSYCKGLVVDRALVQRAYDAWSSRPSGRKNAHRVVEQYGCADALVDEILWEITMRTLEFEPIRRYTHVEPTNGKVRVIGIESVKQQVVDYVACLALEPLLEAKIGFYQVAAVPKKGQRLCRGALRRWVRGATYHVKLDVRQCYPSTSHEVVMGVLRKYVRSADVLYVCESLLATYDMGGLEIGSYFSLRMMQLVLSFAYHHVESLGKVRRGKYRALVDHQLWHLDDALLVGRDKRDLKRAVRSLERYMLSSLGLSIKPWKIARTGDAEPLDMGGWVVRTHRCTLRSRIFLRGMRSFRRFEATPVVGNAKRCASYWGWFRHGDCDGVMLAHCMGATFAHARSVISRHDRQEAAHEAHAVGDAA